MTLVLFSYFAGAIVLTAILVVALRNPIYSALSLLVLFFHVAGIYVLLDAEFIAAIQIIVYAGAILVLYLFVVMLLNLKAEEGYQRQLVLGLLLGLAVAAEAIFILNRSVFGKGIPPPVPTPHPPAGNTEAIGRLLYTTYLFPFEVASLILLVAMIGAIILAKKGIFETEKPQVKGTR
ncbi:MAG TPA: NADH-quinone oxidoreductase subunit J [Nitrospiria bacterium]|nr:NADH-quinone oxidoreductase subunit J [Nitrospiria bacterium]